MLSQPLLRLIVLSLWFGFLLPWFNITATSVPFLSRLGTGILCASALLVLHWCLEPLTTLSFTGSGSPTGKRLASFVQWSTRLVLLVSPALIILALPIVLPFAVNAGLAGILVGTLFISGSLFLVDIATS